MKKKIRKARCKQVLAVLCNKLETLDTIREEVYPPIGDFDLGPQEVMVVRKEGAGSNNEVMIALSTVIFLK